MNRNYQKELDKLITSLEDEGKVPTLLLHSCCAPCSSYCLEYLSNYFRITVLYYNPNIYPEDEYFVRAAEQEKLIENLITKYPVKIMVQSYNPDVFFQMAKGLEHVPEGGERCTNCYELRLREAAVVGSKLKFDYFTTTLSISPLKDAKRLNSIGEELEKEFGIAYLNSDFKKRNGYKRSTELSREYGLYRQNYCGCVYSKRDSLLREGEN